MKSQKCLLNIGGTYYLAPSAEAAAKVMDALATFEPVSVEYPKTLAPRRCLVLAGDYTHKTEIECMPAELLTPAQLESAVKKWLKEEAAQVEACAATTATILPEAA